MLKLKLLNRNPVLQRGQCHRCLNGFSVSDRFALSGWDCETPPVASMMIIISMKVPIHPGHFSSSTESAELLNESRGCLASRLTASASAGVETRGSDRGQRLSVSLGGSLINSCCCGNSRGCGAETQETCI